MRENAPMMLAAIEGFAQAWRGWSRVALWWPGYNHRPPKRLNRHGDRAGKAVARKFIAEMDRTDPGLAARLRASLPAAYLPEVTP